MEEKLGKQNGTTVLRIRFWSLKRKKKFWVAIASTIIWVDFFLLCVNEQRTKCNRTLVQQCCKIYINQNQMFSTTQFRKALFVFADNQNHMQIILNCERK